MLQGLLNGLLYTVIGSILIFAVMCLLVLFIKALVALDRKFPAKENIPQEKLEAAEKPALPASVTTDSIDPRVVAAITAAVTAAMTEEGRKPNIGFRIKRIEKN